MDKTSAAALNSAFMDQMASPEGQQAISEKGLLYIKQKLREESFARKILPPESITKYDVQRSVNSDTVEKIVDIEPESRAAALNFIGEPKARWVDGPRYAIPFAKIASEWFEKTESELLAYEMPIVEIIEENSVKDIMEIEDRRFITFSESAVASTGQTLDDAGSPNLTKTLLTDLFKLIDANRLKTEVLLMSTPTFDDVLNFDTTILGDGVASKVIVDGYTYDQILGKKLIVTTKTIDNDGADLVPFGEIWAYTAPKYLGNFFILNDTKFYIEKIADLIRWTTWEIVGIGIGNRNSIARLRYGTAAP